MVAEGIHPKNSCDGKEGEGYPGALFGRTPSVPVDGKRLGRFLQLVTRGLYWNKFARRIPDDYEFRTHRVSLMAFVEKRLLFEQLKAYGPWGIGIGVFGCMFLVLTENPFVTAWLYWFYEGVFFLVSTGPPEFLPEDDQPGNHPTAIGIWGVPMRDGVLVDQGLID